MRKLEVKHKEKLNEIVRKGVERRDEMLQAVVIKLVESGMTAKEAAKRLGISERSVRRWVKKWNEEGKIEGTKRGKHPKTSHLSEEQIEELKRILEKKEWWSHEEIRELIKKRYGVEYHPEGLRKLLKRMGMKYVKPYPIDYRRPEGAEGTLKESLRLVMEELEDAGVNIEDIVIGFMDETSPELRSNTQRVWTYREKVKMVKNTADKWRANVIGYYAINGKSVEGYLERSTAKEIAKFLEKIKEANKDKKTIIVVLDNFPSHRSKTVREKAKELGIRLVYLP
ncbi:MAG: IS630 family transposase [Thermotogae bacterium]|nr:IS630 family transposase [Thermotogota bacterium]